MRNLNYSFLFAIALGFSAPLCAHAEIPVDSQAPSLFFTQDEIDAIYKANDGIVDNGTGLDASGQAVAAPVDPGPRDLKLAGILFHDEKDWVIWFNGTRVTPNNLPEHMMGIEVRKDRIAVKWFDRGTNKIINLVLRPHQEYHIDTDTITLGTVR
jgi:hypothetical protein